jgi:ABC-type uncharacterized transport system substrate-binding protein
MNMTNRSNSATMDRPVKTSKAKTPKAKTLTVTYDGEAVHDLEGVVRHAKSEGFANVTFATNDLAQALGIRDDHDC